MKITQTNKVQDANPIDKLKIKIEFMIGDADGKTFQTLLLEGARYEEEEVYREEVHSLVRILDWAIALDNKGRGGYDELLDMLDDHYKNPDLEYFMRNLREWDRIVPQTEFPEMMFEIPSHECWYTSFRNYTITYFDTKGVEWNTIIQN